MPTVRIDLGNTQPAEGYSGHTYLDLETMIYSRSEQPGETRAMNSYPSQLRGFFEFRADGDNLGGIPAGSTINSIKWHGELTTLDAEETFWFTHQYPILTKRPSLFVNPDEDADLHNALENHASYDYNEFTWGSLGWQEVILGGTACADLEDDLTTFYFGLDSFEAQVGVADRERGRVAAHGPE